MRLPLYQYSWFYFIRSVDTEQREALFKDVPEERNEVESREDEIET